MCEIYIAAEGHAPDTSPLLPVFCCQKKNFPTYLHTFMIESHCGQFACLSQKPMQYTALGMGYTTLRQVN